MASSPMDYFDLASVLPGRLPFALTEGVFWAGVFISALLGLVAVLGARLRRRAMIQRDLKSRRDVLGTVLDHIPHFVYWKDEEGIYQGCNENFAGLMGYQSPAQIVGKTDDDLPIAPRQRKAILQADRKVLESNQPTSNVQEDFEMPAGKPRTILASRTPIFQKDGRARGVLGLFQDISESRQMESQLRHSQKMEAIGQLAGGIAHDFNNLLAVIQGNAQLLQMFDLCRTSEEADTLNQIVQASRRASVLTQQLLDFARKNDLCQEWTDVHSSIREVVDMLTHSLDRKIEILHDLQASGTKLLLDPSQLQNAILNLCLNARDAMPNGGVLSVETRDAFLEQEFCDRQREEHLQPGKHIEIIVRDTGVGISGAVQRRIFEPFFTSKEVGRGTGLGLAGVHGFVKAHRGLVRVESKVGSGTAMHLLLPLAEASQQASEPAEDPADAQSMPTGGGRVLIVDDEEMVRTFAAKALVSLGYEVIQAPDARSAQDAFQKDPESFELVLMDLILPKTGGDELFARLRRIRPDVRILVMSGYSKQKVVDDLLRSGAQGFLAKPFTLEELSQQVASEIRTPDQSACRAS